jgi:thiol-disulfide isomerase/thioredoxin
MSQSKERRRHVEALQAEQARQKAARARRRTITMVAAPVVIVVLVVAVMIGVKLSGTGQGGTSTPSAPAAAAASTTAKVTGVPATVLDKAGAPASDAKLLPLSGRPPLTQGGKPRILYVGAEYCPYCAAERWPLIVALSRFGTFSGLTETHSSGQDVFPSTATFSFRSATYTSKYLAFTPVETQDAEGKPLQTLSSADQALFTKLNAPPNVPADSAGSIPFIDFGDKYLVSGASFSPQVLSGLDHAKIADQLSDPAGAIGKPVGSVANLMTAGICSLDGNQPAAVCGDPLIKQIQGGLGG